MPHSASLLPFLQAAKAQGASDEFLVNLLKDRGFPQKDIYGALQTHYERATGETLPSRRSKAESAKDAFLYLLSFSTLATWTIALGRLLFELIDRWFSNGALDAAYRNRFDSYSLSNSMAAILVAFPIYAWLLLFLTREREAAPEKKQSSVARWLTYLALFLAAAWSIGDLITFLAFLLRGDLTVRFALKACTVLLIAGGVFGFYLTSLRDDVRDSDT